MPPLKQATRYIPFVSNSLNHVSNIVFKPILKDVPDDQKVADISAQLERSMKILDYWARREFEGRRSGHERDSIYNGISGIAFAEYYLAGSEPSLPSQTSGTRVLMSDADAKLAGILRNTVNQIPSGNHFHPSRLSFIETPLGLAVLVLARSTILSSTNETSPQPHKPLTPSLDTHSSSDDVSAQTIVGLHHTALALITATVRKVLELDGKIEEQVWQGDQVIEDGCEVLYGRAGLLYGLLYLRNAIRNTDISQESSLRGIITEDTLSMVVEGIIARGKIGAQAFEAENEVIGHRHSGVQTLRGPPVMWRWYGKRYLGAAHGVVGILQTLLSCPLGTIERHLPVIIGTVQWLIDCQDTEGNWPTQASSDLLDYHQQRSGKANRHELVHWCHGAPGVLILLSTTFKFCTQNTPFISALPEAANIFPRLEEAMKRGGMLVYQRGFLRKGVGLCHGVAGSVYALLSVSDVLDKDTDTAQSSPWLHRALQMAYIATFYDRLTEAKEMSVPDHPMSLYEGLAGMCCAWSEVLNAMKRVDSESNRSRKGMPGYADLAY